ncbi:MAG: hypothetical protein MHM6MM_001128, partial [Cercozoa sp. M6MM]
MQRRALRVCCAPNAFKECLGADEAALALARGVRRAARSFRTEVDVSCFPLCDGGDGSLQVIAKALSQSPSHVTLEKRQVNGPLGTSVEAECALIRPNDPSAPVIGVVEMAEASGIRFVQQVSSETVWNASTYGTGELIAHLLRQVLHRSQTDLRLCWRKCYKRLWHWVFRVCVCVCVCVCV